ncbi:MAG: sigma-70 family RNA polymerase sigma factor [Acidobacteriota bacterium]
MTPPDTEITQLLKKWRNGDQAALDQLMPLVYGELHHLAKRAMNQEHVGHTLQTTALVNEAYLRMCNLQQVEWQDRAHFFAVASRVMRHLLVDHARAQGYAKRGGGILRVELDEAAVYAPERSADLLALDDALNRLAVVDEKKCRIVELRYFGGLTVEEVAEVLGVAVISVKREWAKAKLWLYQELQSNV